jgi:hypothetical protein
METKLQYALSQDVVNYILNALNRNQIAGVQQAKDLLTVVELLQNPLNIDEIEKAQYEELKGKFEKKEK